jgi:hypothetical protein
MMVIAVAALFGGAAWSDSARAEWHRVCIGQYQGGCRFGWDRWFPCGTSAQAASAQTCLIRTPRGPVWRRYSQPIKVADVGGNRCGYYTFDVFCYW